MNPETPLLDFYCEGFCPIALAAASPNTLRLYATTIRSLGRFLEREPALGDLADETVNGYLSWFLALGRSPFSAEKERANLLAMWRFAAGEWLIDLWPDVAPVCCERREPVHWSEIELHQFRQACNRVAGDISGVPAPDWWYAFHCVVWEAGQRYTAALTLKWENVDLPRRRITFEPGTFNSRRHCTRLHVRLCTAAALKAISEPARQFVFPWPASPRAVWCYYRDVLLSAGIPVDRVSRKVRLDGDVARADAGEVPQSPSVGAAMGQPQSLPVALAEDQPASVPARNGRRLPVHERQRKPHRRASAGEQMVANTSERGQALESGCIDEPVAVALAANDMRPPAAPISDGHAAGQLAAADMGQSWVGQLFRRYVDEELNRFGRKQVQQGTMAVEAMLADGIRDEADLNRERLLNYLGRLRKKLKQDKRLSHRNALIRFFRWLHESELYPGAISALQAFGFPADREGGAA